MSTNVQRINKLEQILDQNELDAVDLQLMLSIIALRTAAESIADTAADDLATGMPFEPIKKETVVGSAVDVIKFQFHDLVNDVLANIVAESCPDGKCEIVRGPLDSHIANAVNVVAILRPELIKMNIEFQPQ